MEEKQPTNNSGEGNQPSANDLIERANIAREKLEETEKRVTEKIKQLEEIEARRIVGGKTDAGIQPAQPKEETPKEYAKRIMSGK